MQNLICWFASFSTELHYTTWLISCRNCYHISVNTTSLHIITVLYVIILSIVDSILYAMTDIIQLNNDNMRSDEILPTLNNG